MAALSLGPVDLLGFSTGGRAATAFVERHPEDVRRLILASTSAYPSSDGEQYLQDWAEYQRRLEGERAAEGGRFVSGGFGPRRVGTRAASWRGRDDTNEEFVTLPSPATSRPVSTGPLRDPY
ncbi:alpha/beta fold hydrolase [Microlunatus soli]|uniref:alpha/beta fold hydrolase n=1 Tax=Microlunatus soli TaxID=630515 RepID=UPI0038B232CC